MLGIQRNDKSRRFLVGLGTGIVAASLLTGLTMGTSPATSTMSRLAPAAQVTAAPSTTAPSSRSTAAEHVATPTTPAAQATAAVTPRPGLSATSTPASPRTRSTATPRATTKPSAKAPKPPSKAPRVSAPRQPAAPVQQAGPTGWPALNAAIARIPGYRQGAIRWSVTDRYGHYGTTDLATSAIYISPGVPGQLLDSVVRHEYAHVVSVRAYGGQWRTARSALNAAFGGTGMTGVERAADCMALAIGATWTHHTSCSSRTWQAMARRLLSGHPA